jgi:hypothetical protein
VHSLAGIGGERLPRRDDLGEYLGAFRIVGHGTFAGADQHQVCRTGRSTADRADEALQHPYRILESIPPRDLHDQWDVRCRRDAGAQHLGKTFDASAAAVSGDE